MTTRRDPRRLRLPLGALAALDATLSTSTDLNIEQKRILNASELRITARP